MAAHNRNWGVATIESRSEQPTDETRTSKIYPGLHLLFRLRTASKTTGHFQNRTGLFCSLRARVRRCMPRRRAVSEILKPVSAKVSLIRSHSSVLIEVVRVLIGVAALPSSRAKAASISSVLQGLGR